MRWLTVILCCFLLSACADPAKPADPPSSQVSAPDTTLTERQANESSEAGGSGQPPGQSLYEQYFSTEHRWNLTKISGDTLETSLQDAPYESETAYHYFAAPDGSVTRAVVTRDPYLGNWRAQEAEPVTGDLQTVTEIATLDSLVVPPDIGRPFFVEEGKRIVDTDVNCQDKVLYYESTGTISGLQVGSDLLFFLENESTLCRLHRASGIVDQWELPAASVNHYTVVTSEAVQWTSPTAEFSALLDSGGDTGNLPASFKREDAFLLDCKSGVSRKLDISDYDKDGLLLYHVR